jgi:hypothetical protein
MLQMCWGMFEPPALLDVPSPLSYSPRSSECSTDGSVESVTRDFEVICVRACGCVALLLADATACARCLTVFLAQSLTYISCDNDDHDEMEGDELPGGERQSEVRPPSAAARRPPGIPNFESLTREMCFDSGALAPRGKRSTLGHAPLSVSLSSPRKALEEASASPALHHTPVSEQEAFTAPSTATWM